MSLYSPIDIPASGYDMIGFSEEREREIRKIADKAAESKRWEWAEALPIDLSSNEFWAYWLGKTSNIIMNPLRDCAYLREAFEPFRRTAFALNQGAGQSDITISAVGDLMCTKGIGGCKDTVYKNVSDLIFNSDIRFANLESTFSGGDIEPITFNADEGPVINLDMAQYKALTEHEGKRYTIVQLANNHIVDSGEEGALKTLEQLNKDGIAQVGLNLKGSDADKTTITDNGDLKTGWIAHTFFVNFRPLPEGKPWFVNITPFYVEDKPDLSAIFRQIQYCKERNCDLIIVSLHWGLEFELYPHPQQRQWAQSIADAGADIILGHHPHVISFAEILHPKNEPEKDIPVIYSLGNLTPIFSSPGTALSLIARFSVSRQARPASVTKMELYPVALMKATEDKTTAMELVRLSRLLEDTASVSDGGYIDKMAGIADAVLGDSWR